VCYLLICNAIFIIVTISEYSSSLAILIKREGLSFIKISVFPSKDSAYFTDWYSHKYCIETNEISLILI